MKSFDDNSRRSLAAARMMPRYDELRPQALIEAHRRAMRALLLLGKPGAAVRQPEPALRVGSSGHRLESGEKENKNRSETIAARRTVFGKSF